VYTQCPDCATVFRITAEALRAAQGDVRCGVCSTSFNALENLSERAFEASAEDDAPSPDDSMTVEELPGNENIELSAPVELMAVPDAPAEPDVPADAPSGEPANDEALAMEFHGDAEDLDRLFVVENPALSTFDPGQAAANLAVAEPPIDLDSTDEHPILVLEERDEAELEEVAGESIVLETPPAPEPEAEPVRQPPLAPLPPTAPAGLTAPRILIPDEMRKRLAAEATARAEAAREFEPDEPEMPAFLAQRWPWVAGVAILAFVFVLQVVHAARNDIVRNETFGPALAGAYDFLGLSVLAPTDLTAYELRQWGAASDPREANRLMLRASIVNRANYAQPLPLLRLTLQDRFGGTLGQRDVGPADYLPGSGAPSLLAPGQRADALIRIVDPGSEAVGFELDVCLPAQGGVRCANQIKTARQ
jgi:predicted Zn finger-like uncharacterized protein